ncbi:MAG: MFS transporter [Ruminococcaceae bacterium]|nr:MFS transporter [Oscillospiraceae bacterium]
MNTINYNSPDYRRSRTAYIVQCAFEYLVTLLVTDAFLAKLLSNLDMSDAMVGIISSFTSLAFLIQLFSIFLVNTEVSRKKLVVVFDTLSLLAFMFIYFVPFLPVGGTAKKLIVMLSVMLAYAGKYLISSICYKWANSYVEPTRRAQYSAVKEIISLISGIVFTAFMGYVVDRFESLDNLEGGFLFIALSLLLLNICNFISLMMIKKEEPSEIQVATRPWGEVMQNTLLNRNFRNVIILTILWESARYFTVGFLGVYKTNDLCLSVFAVQLINMVANGCRMFVSVPFGRYSDRHTFAKGFELALFIAATAFFCNIFTSPQTCWMIVIYTILYNVCLAGINANSFNITYSYVKNEYFAQAMALKNSIGGLCGFGASLLAGKILSAVQANGNQMFGIPLYGQQLLSAISFTLLVAAALFTHFVIAKQKVIVQ